MAAVISLALTLCWVALVFANYHSAAGFPPFEVVRALWPAEMSAGLSAGVLGGHLRHILVALAILLSARGMGRIAGRLFPGSRGIPFLPSALGILALGSAVLGFGLAGLLHAPVLGVAVLAGVAMGGVPPHRLPGGLPRPLIALVAAAGIVPLFGALVPEVTYDALAYHLGAPAEFLKAGRIVRLERMFFTDFPLGLQSVYTAALGLGGGSESAKLVHWALGLLCVGAAFRLGRRVGGSSVGAWSAAMFAASALAATQMAKANVDLGVAFLSTVGLLALLESRGVSGALVAGICLGGAASVKLTGGIAVAGGLVFLLWSRRGRGVVLALAGGALLALLAWLLRGWLSTGNPVYPFLWKALGGVGWAAENAAAYRFDMTGPTSFNVQYALPTGRLAGPWLSALHERASGAGLGPFALALAPLAVLSWARLGGPVRGAAVFAGTGWLAWFFLARDTRFLLPLLPAFTALSAVALAGIPGAAGAVVRAACVAACAFAPFQDAHFSYRSLNPAAVVWGAVPPGVYFDRLVPPPGFVGLARHAGTDAPGGRVLVVGDVKGAGTGPRALYQSMFDTPHLAAGVRESASAERLRIWFRQRGIASVLYNRGGAIYLRGQFGHYKWTSRERKMLGEFMGRRLAPVREFKEGRELSMGLYRVLAKPGSFNRTPIPGE